MMIEEVSELIRYVTTHYTWPLLVSTSSGSAHSQTGATLSLNQFWLGIAVTILVFLAQEQIKHSVSGFRFRKRIVKDIQVMIENYFKHLPSLISIQDSLQSHIKALETGVAIKPEIYPIWSGEYSVIGDIFENSEHFDPEAYVLVVDFYDLGDRLEPVRNAYNSVVQQCSVAGSFGPSALIFLNGCLKFMRNEYKKLIVSGCDALVVVSKKHIFLHFDTSRCLKIKGELSA
jgi:hypothetical protein